MKSLKTKGASLTTKDGYGGAATNLRIIEIRRQDGFSRAELAIITGYSRSYIDNFLSKHDSPNWREAPQNAVRLLEIETGRKKPMWLKRRGHPERRP